jgi:hypothetical protein
LYIIHIESIIDPCVSRSTGILECGEMHHMWQVAGPGGTLPSGATYPAGPMYPDCSGTGGPLPCNSTMYTDQHKDNGESKRGVFVASLSALITTSGHYQIDIRWPKGVTSPALTPDPDFNTAQLEAIWQYNDHSDVGTVTYIRGYALCYADNAPQRAEGTLVSDVDFCSTLNSGGDVGATIETRW